MAAEGGGRGVEGGKEFSHRGGCDWVLGIQSVKVRASGAIGNGVVGGAKTEGWWKGKVVWTKPRCGAESRRESEKKRLRGWTVKREIGAGCTSL